MVNVTISNCQLFSESLPLWFIWKKNCLWSQIEVWTLLLTKPDSQQQAERGRVVMHMKDRLLILMKLFFIRSFYVTDTSVSHSSCFQWSVETSPQSNLAHLGPVTQMDIKEDKRKMTASWKHLKSLFIQGGFTEHTWPFLETLCFAFIQPSFPPESPYSLILPEVVGVKCLLTQGNKE